LKLLRRKHWKPVLPSTILPFGALSGGSSVWLNRGGLSGGIVGDSCSAGWVSICLEFGRNLGGRCSEPFLRYLLFIAFRVYRVLDRGLITRTSFGLVLWARYVFSFGLKISAWGTALRCWDVSICVFAMLTKWFSMTRLETRTKESNIYASVWVENPCAK
jgi:hypothetical protein